MDIARIKLTLMERLMLVWDEASLKRIGSAIETEISETSDVDDYSDEVVAELDRQQALHLNGETRSYSREEAIRMMREGPLRDAGGLVIVPRGADAFVVGVAVVAQTHGEGIAAHVQVGVG